MRQPSPLNTYLTSLQDEGVFDSTGRFTMSREKAVEKLAAFALPLPESWALCLIQFAVGAGASEIRFALRADTVQFRAVIHADWQFPNFMATLFDLPDGLPDELKSLVLALWQTSFAQGRDVLFSPPASSAFLLAGGGVRELERTNDTQFLIEISHSGASRKTPAWINADILDIISENAYVCPIPLWVDGRRIDNLLNETEASLIDLFELPSGLPEIQQARIGTPYHLNRAGNYRCLPEWDWPGHGKTGGLCVTYLAAQLEYQSENSPAKLELGNRRSSINWVKNGIIVDSGSVTLPHCRGFFFQLFLSAVGLSKDLSGQLVRCPEYKQRRTWALTHLSNRLTGRDHGFQFAPIAQPKKPPKKWFFGLIVLNGSKEVERSDYQLDEFLRKVNREYDNVRRFLSERQQGIAGV